MRSSSEGRARGHKPVALTIGLAFALGGCGASGAQDAVLSDARPAVPAQTGPAADYPVVVGSPYEVNGVLYTPVDRLNYDEVGYATLDTAGGDAVSAAHHTLPLPSYVEVTSLATGRTILVRVERRGPMTDNSLIALSPGATAQLSLEANAPVRVRRVNPPETERASLRLGGRAPERLETPETLLAVLRRKLPEAGSASLAPEKAAPEVPTVAATEPVPAPSQAPVTVDPSVQPVQAEAPSPAPAPTPTPAPAQQALTATLAPKPRSSPRATPAVTPNGNYVVQAGAFSTSDRAEKVAKAIGGSVSKSGKLFRVRTGPFATRAQAEASLAKVKAAGYSDARIFTRS